MMSRRVVSLLAKRRFCAVAPLNLDRWIAEHGGTLKPPVANKLLYGSSSSLKVMVVGGPNERRDYHLQHGEEFFVQLKGELVLKVVERGVFKDVTVKAGQAFLLPALVPHSPQRSAGSIGLVFERSHSTDELDGMMWFDPARERRGGEARRDDVEYDEYFHCVDLGKQLAPVIARYGEWRDAKLPARRDESPPLTPDDAVTTEAPAALDAALTALLAPDQPPSTTTLLHRGDEILCDARVGPAQLSSGGSPFDLFAWQRAGTSSVDFRDGKPPVRFGPGDVALIPKGSAYDWTLDADACLLSVANVFT